MITSIMSFLKLELALFKVMARLALWLTRQRYENEKYQFFLRHFVITSSVSPVGEQKKTEP